MFKVTTICSHTGSRVLGEVCHRFVDVFLWQLFRDGSQDDFQLIVLGFGWILPHLSSMAP